MGISCKREFVGKILFYYLLAIISFGVIQKKKKDAWWAQRLRFISMPLGFLIPYLVVLPTV